MLCTATVCFFFFQAEDGIRDLVRSRGLGDVYKRQILGGESSGGLTIRGHILGKDGILAAALVVEMLAAVSYTHLTLPTIYSV